MAVRVQRPSWTRAVACPPDFLSTWSDALEFSPVDYYFWETPETLESLLEVWGRDTPTRPEYIALELAAGDGAERVHAAARAAAVGGAAWYLDAYAEAVFYAAKHATSLSDFEARAGVMAPSPTSRKAIASSFSWFGCSRR